MTLEELLSIPAIAELATRHQWVNWALRLKDGKWTKPPVDRDGELLRWKDPANLSTLQEALDVSNKIGFVFTSKDPFCGIDLDGCRNAETGVIIPAARDLIERLNSYTEISPSGTGVKIYLLGSIPGGRCSTAYDWVNDCPCNETEGRKEKIECFDHGRHFAVTGQYLEGTPRTIESNQPAIDGLWKHLFPVPKVKPQREAPRPSEPSLLSDEDLIRKASRAKNGAKFTALYVAGQWQDYPSWSEADLALMVIFAFYTWCEKSRMIRLFKSSALWSEERAKAKGADYLERTADKAIEKQGSVKYEAPHRHKAYGTAPRSASAPRAQRSTPQPNQAKVHVVAAARPQPPIPAMPKLPEDASTEAVLEALNGILRELEVDRGPLQVMAVDRASGILVETNRGTVEFPTAGDLLDFKRAKAQVADDIGIVLPVDRTPQIRVLWNNAASLILRLRGEYRPEKAATVVVREALQLLWVAGGRQRPKDSMAFAEAMKNIEETVPDRGGLISSSVFLAKGFSWVHQMTARAWLMLKYRDVDIERHWLPGMKALGFMRKRPTESDGGKTYRMWLYRGPASVLEDPPDSSEASEEDP